MREFEKIAIKGGGVMGRGIAWTAGVKGIRSVIIERDLPSAMDSRQALEGDLDAEIARWGLTESEKGAILARVEFTVETAAAEGASMAIEAVPEDFALKERVFSEFEEVLEDDAVIATSTASFSVTELASSTKNPKRFIGLRFIRPVPMRPLVEILRGLRTADWAFDKARRFALELEKTPVEVFESPGAITVRGIAPFLNEAMNMLMEGVATAEDIDTSMRLGFNLPYGPLGLADRIGLDVVLAWMEHLVEETKDPKYRPSPVLKKMVRAGHLGKKTGEGFFQYGEAGNGAGNGAGGEG